MDTSAFSFAALGLGMVAVVLAVAFFLWRKLMTVAPLPPMPAFGALPVRDVARYHAVDEPALAWEAVRGWGMNHAPLRLDANGTIAHAILTPRLLDLCAVAEGRVSVVLSLFLANVTSAEFDAHALPPGIAPSGSGLLWVRTSVGVVQLICSSAFAEALRGAIARAHDRPAREM